MVVLFKTTGNKKMTNLNKIEKSALFMRKKILEISHNCGISAHLGGGLSMVEIMAVLYTHVLKIDNSNPHWPQRDRFILSKGHGVLGFYSALLVAKIIDEDEYSSFQTNESNLIAHPVMNLDLGIESSNGSLGQGLSMGIGIALGAKIKNKSFKTYILLGDGECDEGSVWEAVMLAPQLNLDNLVAIVDYNKLQSDGGKVIDLSDLASKFEGFGWDTYNVDGHNIERLLEAFEAEHVNNKPKMIVANTIKGKGVSFMENDNAWHHNLLTKNKYEAALEELKENYGN